MFIHCYYNIMCRVFANRENDVIISQITITRQKNNEIKDVI